LKKDNASNAWKPDWPLIFICAATFIFLLLLPLFLGGKREDAYFSYKIMWLNYLGRHFKLPLETPKPLFALVCGTIGHSALYPAICIFTTGILALLMKTAQKFGKPFWAGAVAFVLFMACNTIVIPEFIMSAYYPMLYLFLALAAVYSFVNQWRFATVIALLGAGLLRPEAWLLPPVFILLTLFKKERGFSWWLFIPLLAPVIWRSFDHAISGSATYSNDLTNYYILTLGVKPVNFHDFWAAAGANIMAVYNLPVHLLGLLGLFYYAIRTKRVVHLLMAILVLMPFLFFWLLSAKAPILFQVRFFALPMLICCLYAVLVFAETFHNKWVLGVGCVALLCIGAKYDLPSITAATIKTDNAVAETRAGTLETVRNLEKEADVVLCGRSAGFFAYHLGEKASRKIFMFREAEARRDFEQGISRGVAVYIRNDMAGWDRAFSFLSAPRTYEVNGFRFFPVKITRGGDGIVYAFEKMPGAGGKK